LPYSLLFEGKAVSWQDQTAENGRGREAELEPPSIELKWMGPKGREDFR
jgi:hypothetical protein